MIRTVHHRTEPGRRASAARAGFTLLELLLVIAIIILLVALVTVGVGRVRTVQMAKTTEASLHKLQFALDRRDSSRRGRAPKIRRRFESELEPHWP